MAITENRGYPKPVPAHNISDDVALIQQSLDMIDADVAAALLSLASKAAVVHGHAMSEISGLVSALANKSDVGHNHALSSLSETSGLAEAPDGYVISKAGGVWTPVSRATIMQSHGHTMGDVSGLDTALAAKLSATDIAALAAKGTLAVADGIVIVDSEAGGALKLGAYSTLRSVLKTYFDAIYASIASGVPTGTVLEFAGSVAPTGFLLCDGAAYSRTSYAALFAAIGTSHGAGDGVTTFNVPDDRDRAVIGKGDMGGVGANRLGASLTGTRASTSSGVITGLSSTVGLAVGMVAIGTGIPAGATIVSIDSSTQVTLSANSSSTGSGTIRFAVLDDQTLGATGGAAVHKLTAGQMPAHTHNTGTTIAGRNTSTGGDVIVYAGSSYTGTSAGGDQAHPNVQPVIVRNKIIKT